LVLCEKEIPEELQPLFFLPFENLKNSDLARGKKLPAIFLPMPLLSSLSAARPNAFQLHADDGAKDTGGKDELFPRSSLTKRTRKTTDGVREKKEGEKNGLRDKGIVHVHPSLVCLSLSHHEIICRAEGRSVSAS
jgi:hypothetical protein